MNERDPRSKKLDCWITAIGMIQMAQGYKDKDIVSKLHISENTFGKLRRGEQESTSETNYAEIAEAMEVPREDLTKDVDEVIKEYIMYNEYKGVAAAAVLDVKKADAEKVLAPVLMLLNNCTDERLALITQILNSDIDCSALSESLDQFMPQAVKVERPDVDLKSLIAAIAHRLRSEKG